MSDNNNNKPHRNRLVIKGYKGPIPVFLQSEVWTDRMLGNGSFCAAWTIQQVELSNDETAKNLPNQETRRSLAEQINESRRSHCKAPLRCVVKKPRNDLYANIHNGDRSLEDLRYELKILHRVGTGQHPNIIQLYAVGASEIENDEEHKRLGGVTFRPAFLILSRIQYTVEDLIGQWRDQRGLRVYEALAIDQNSTRQLWKERMTLLARVADALKFLHSKRVILRDLKPENVGRDYQAVVKVFDFGLARQIDRDDHGLEKLYRLTGNTGTQRYMSPEIAKHKKYGYSADVYCLAIFMHEVLSLKTPFASLSSNTFHERVYERGVRPPLEGSWPPGVRDLIQSMWIANPTQRPTAAEVTKTLTEILKGSDDDLYPSALFSRSRWFPAKQQPDCVETAEETSSQRDDPVETAESQ